MTDRGPTAGTLVDRQAGDRVTSHRLLIIGAMGLSAVVSHALARSTFPILLPAIESELLSNRQQSGFLGSANFVAYLLGVVAVTTISGRVEPIRLLSAGLFATVIGFGWFATADGFAALAAGQAFTGFGSAGIWMSAPTIATGAVAGNRRGIVMGFMSSTMGLGILVTGQSTNLVRSLAGDNELWRPTWIGCAVFAAIMFVLVTWILRAPVTKPAQSGISIARLRTVPRWLPLIVSYWLFGLISSSFAAFFGLLAKDQGFSPGHITNLFSVLGLAAVVGAVSLGGVSDRIGRRPVLAAAMVGIAASAGLALIGREPFASLSIAVFGATSFTFPVLTIAYLRDHLADRKFSNALGALTIIYGSALVIGPSLAGTVADSRFGLDTVFVGLGVVALLGAAAAAFLEPGQ